MTDSPLRVDPISPVIGAEISGIDLSAPLTPEVVETLHQALMTHLVLFFRDQALSFEQHKAFGRHFGDLHIHPAAPKDVDHPEILVVHGDATVKFVAGELWHSDVSCDVEPPLGSILRIEQVPTSGGDTLFASMYAAYEALSGRLQRFLGELTAVHDGQQYYVGRYGGRDLRDGAYPSAEHPAIRTHPVTGRQALYVNEVFTTGFKELKQAESNALLSFVLKHCAAPEFQCRFRWRQNSVAFWDNRCTQHHAIWDYYPQTRHGYRVTIKGDRPFYAEADVDGRRAVP
ncbi:MAG TPA: taurine dioxygenase [Acidobacteria bacterium]|jgi:taurine dioxygenase|nr:taurine dioxygenase [Acidobacteriota bacterium]HIN12202.1 taurine dioxygenase [Acidobacteriota bacterium]